MMGPEHRVSSTHLPVRFKTPGLCVCTTCALLRRQSGPHGNCRMSAMDEGCTRVLCTAGMAQGGLCHWRVYVSLPCASPQRVYCAHDVQEGS